MSTNTISDRLLQDALARCVRLLLVLVPRPRISWKPEGKFFNSASRDDHEDWLVAAHSVNQGFVARTDPLSDAAKTFLHEIKNSRFRLSLASAASNASRSTTDFETRLLALTASSAGSISGRSFTVTVFHRRRN